MRLLIVRHGDPDYANDSLTPKGHIEARLLAERLRLEGPTHLYCSPLGRAQATAAPAAEILGLPVETFDWLREYPAHIKTDYRPDGMCPWEMRPNHWSVIPGLFDREEWLRTEPFVSSRVPEVYADICAHFDALLAFHGYRRDRQNGLTFQISETASEAAVLVFFCHHGLGLALISRIMGLSLAQLWQTIAIAPSAVSEFHMERRQGETFGSADKAGEDYGFLRCRYIGDISHLYKANLTPSNDQVPQI
ncbi:MAG: histidine phosphatase family protein [Oscillospiraceae bacterium]|nr:histidine phosphatase family protein [Oscillospiraceae bacterium]